MNTFFSTNYNYCLIIIILGIKIFNTRRYNKTSKSEYEIEIQQIWHIPGCFWYNTLIRTLNGNQY